MVLVDQKKKILLFMTINIAILTVAGLGSVVVAVAAGGVSGFVARRGELPDVVDADCGGTSDVAEPEPVDETSAGARPLPVDLPDPPASTTNVVHKVYSSATRTKSIITFVLLFLLFLFLFFLVRFIRLFKTQQKSTSIHHKQ